MICQVKRTKGQITEVLAVNEKKSMAYQTLLNIVNGVKDRTVLENQFKNWVGTHINNVTDPKELALALYKQLYSPAFKDWFGTWNKVAEAVSHKDEIKGYYKFAFEQDPQLALYEAAAQANSSESEKQGTISTFGENITRIAQELFPDANGSNTFYNPVVGNIDENGEPLLLNNTYTNYRGDSRNILNNNNQANQGLSQLTDSSLETIPSKASRETIATIKEFLNRLGVKLESVTGIVVDGKKIGANGMADAVNRLVQVVEGKEDVALPEEAFHIAVEIIQQKDPALFKEMMNKIGQYNMYDKVLKQYKGTYLNEYGQPDIPKIKKETIAKVLAEMFIRDNQEVAEKPEFLTKTQTWWQKVLESLKKFFLRTGMNIFKEDPFDVALGTIKDENVSYDTSKVDAKEGEFLQKTESQSLTDKLINTDRKVARTEDGYEVGGKKTKSVQYEVEHSEAGRKIKRNFEKSAAHTKADKEYKAATEGTIKQDINDIFRRYINDDGNVRDTPLERAGVSAIDPVGDEFYPALEENMVKRINSYPTGTKFFYDLNVYNVGTNTAGTIDFLAVTDKEHGEKVDIIQFKAPETRSINDETSRLQQDEYNSEVEALRQILEKGYGIKRSQFDKTRTIPIKANYTREVAGDMRSPITKVATLAIGNVNVKLEPDDTLLPLASISELTGNNKFDTFIGKLRGLLAKIRNNYDPAVSSVERQETINSLYRSIKKLQIQKSAVALINNAKVINKRLEKRYAQLKKLSEDTNPSQATIDEMSKIAAKIIEDWEEAEIYTNMDEAIRGVLDSTEENKQVFRDARDAADNAKDLATKYLELAKFFQTKKFAAKVGILDEFLPEKQLNWYRRMVRSLSQSNTTAGKLLWKLVLEINNGFQIQFRQRLEQVKEIEKNVTEWMKKNGKNLNDLYHKFFQYDSKGNWTGRVIQQYDKKFYKDLQSAKENNDIAWVNENIDMEAYGKWFLKRHAERIEEVRNGGPYSDDETESEQRIYNMLNQFVNTYSPESKFFVSKSNNELKNFPLQKWESKEYIELSKPENQAVKTLWEHWKKRLEESSNNGMIAEHHGWSWFPNVRRNMLEKLTTAKAGGKWKDFLLGSTVIDREDPEFGKLDPITNRPVNEIHAHFISDLGQRVEETDGSYWNDYSDKSMDIFKVLALWDREIIKYNLKTEAEGLAKMIAFTEKNRGSLLTGKGGKLIRDERGNPLPPDDNNETNARYIQEHIEAALYGKGLSNESDVTFNVPVKAIAEKINKWAGREVFKVPKQDTVTISGVKGVAALNRFFLTKTLGLNVLTSLANAFGGHVNAYINQGKYFNKKDLAKAELDMVSSSLGRDEKGRKIAGLLGYLHPYLEDSTDEEIRTLSVSKSIRVLSADRLFFMQRLSDKWVNKIIAISFINNAMIRDGKIMNIREVAREELGFKENKYSGDYKDTVEFNKKVEERVQELKDSKEALLNYAEIKDDKITIPGMDIENFMKTPETITAFREQVLQFIKDALGNTSREDLSLYKRYVLYQSFAMFKNWIPRMVDVRGQSLRYNAGTNQYEWGRIRMLGDAVMHMGLSSIRGLIKTLGGNDETVINAAKKSYEKIRAERQEEQQDFDISEAEFIDMYVKGVSAQFKEIGLALAFIGFTIAARLAAPEGEDDPVKRGTYKWMLRGIDKLQDEISFFYNPQSFSDILGGSPIATVGLLLDAERFLSSGIAKGFYSAIGDDQKADKQHPAKYVLRALPVTKELLNYWAIFDEDLAKKYDLRVSSRNGSSR